jgi:Chaperone of endosialidase
MEGALLCTLTKSSPRSLNSNPGSALAANCLDKLARFSRNSLDMKTSIPPALIIIVIFCFGVLPKAQAVSPAPDGGYPGGNTAEGQAALLSRTTGTYNTAVGYLSLRSDTGGSYNTALGAGALLANTADENTATGVGALLSNTTGEPNTATGALALFSNTTGSDNTANGHVALFSNTTGQLNTANGSQALYNNTTGIENTATGFGALYFNIGDDNTATGFQALNSNTTGNLNTANGYQALYFNQTGHDNTAIGERALYNNTAGISNAAIGTGALFFNTTGSGNVALGYIAGSAVTTANSVICILSPGADVSNSCYIGNIRDVTTQNADAIPVVIDSAGQLGTASSSRRFKKEIKPMDQTSEAILGLKPVTFQYKSDKTNTSQFGLIAEEVAEVNPDLVVHDKNGEIYTVRYEAVNAMLLNEFLKEHSTVQELKNEVAALTATVKEQTAQIQRVSAQLEAGKHAPQVVNNP